MLVDVVSVVWMQFTVSLCLTASESPFKKLRKMSGPQFSQRKGIADQRFKSINSLALCFANCSLFDVGSFY